MEDLSYPIGKFTHIKELTPTQREQGIKTLEALPGAIRETVKTLNEAQLETPYRDGGWTVKQVIHHLVDSHMNSYIRFKLALTEDNPTIKPYKQSQWAEFKDAKTDPIDLSLTMLDGIHRKLVSTLRGMKPEDFKRTFNHPENGPMTLDDALAMYDWHSRHHTAHITNLKSRKGWS